MECISISPRNGRGEMSRCWLTWASRGTDQDRGYWWFPWLQGNNISNYESHCLNTTLLSLRQHVTRILTQRKPFWAIKARRHHDINKWILNFPPGHRTDWHPQKQINQP